VPWYGYSVLFVSGLFLVNGVPHFVHGASGAPFQSPFANPRGVGESSPLVNVLWGFFNFVVGFVLLGLFTPEGKYAPVGWIAFAAGALLISVFLSLHFGRVRVPKS
jgi:hypothetical protein